MAHIYFCKKDDYSKGMTALVTVLVIGAMLLLIAGSAAFQAYQENSANSKNIRLKEANVLAESGFDEAMLRLERDKTLSVTTTISVDNSHYASVKIERNTPAIGQTTITSRGCSYNVERVIKSIVAIDDTTGLIRMVSQENIPATDNICTQGACGTLVIGTSYQGGKIAYIDDSVGCHGLIAALSDQGINATWGCYETVIPGADGIAIGTGHQNTHDMIAAGCTNAAQLTHGITINGYSDWFLPSKDELNQLYMNRAVIGGFTNDYYWSSSEVSAQKAWIQGFLYGDQIDYRKDQPITIDVRAVRAF